MLKQIRKLVGIGLLVTVLLLITLVSTYAADTGEIVVSDDVPGVPIQRESVATASDGHGNTVIAWAQSSDGSYPNPRKIYFRRYDSSGVSSPSVEVVALPSNQGGRYVDVAVNDSGAFVVTWTQAFTDADGDSVHAALFDSAGSMVRSAFQVNTSETGYQWRPSAAIDDTGAFLIAWFHSDYYINFAEANIYAQRFDNLGQPVNGEMVVNTVTDGVQGQPDAAMNGGGEAVIVWHSQSSSVQDEAIYGQLFNDDGSRSGGEFQISSSRVTNPAVAMDESGAFVATWEGDIGSARNVYARQFDANGVAIAAEFLVNTETTYNQAWPDIAVDNLGNFAVVWTSDRQDGLGDGVYAQLYDDSGIKFGDEFRVNVRTDEQEAYPVVAMSDTSQYAFAWSRYNNPLSGDEGIYARFIDGPPANTAPAVYAGNYDRAFSKPLEGESYTLSAAKASDPDGDALIYSWAVDNTEVCSFSDTTVLNPTITCSDDGSFTVTLTVGDGTTTNASDSGLTVLNVPPDITISGDSTVAVGDTYTLTLGAITDPGDDTVSEILVNWGDGIQDIYTDTQYITTKDVTHVYTAPADEYISVSLKDEESTPYYYSNRANLSLTVTTANNAPAAMDDAYTTDEDTPLTLDPPGVLANDSDPDGDALTATLETDVSNGSLTLNDDGSFSYVPHADYFGPDTFSYSASDGELTSNIATVTIDVLSVNDPPVAGDDNATTDEDTAVTIDLAANDTDVESNLDPSSVTLTGQPANGAATNHADGTVTYTPDPDYNGPDSYSYQICDSDGLCDTAVVTLTVNPINDAPVANAGGPYSGGEGSALVLSGAASDVDGDALSYTWTSDGPCNFSDVSVPNPTLTCDDNGSFTATLTVEDGMTSTSESAAVTVANVAPTAAFAASSTSINEGSSVTLAFSDQSDPSGADTAAGFSYSYDCDGDGTFETIGSSDNYSCTYSDDGTFTALGRIEDKDSGYSDYTGSITVNNVAPTIDSVDAPTDPVAIDAQPLGIQIYFSDPGTADTHQIDVDWGDGTIDTVIDATSPATFTHTYTEVGVYSVGVTVTDNAGESDITIYDSIVVYDPYSGSVVGNGRITSQAGWCYDSALCGNLVGQVGRFSFHSDYHRGATVPTGRTTFIFRMAGFAFESTSIDWLVVNQGGTNAQFHGEGTINGQAATSNGDPYHFMIWAGDGTGPGGEDTFRIKIWYEVNGQETVVYDIGAGATFDIGQIRVQAQ